MHNISLYSSAEASADDSRRKKVTADSSFEQVNVPDNDADVEDDENRKDEDEDSETGDLEWESKSYFFLLKYWSLKLIINLYRKLPGIFPLYFNPVFPNLYFGSHNTFKILMLLPAAHIPQHNSQPSEKV